MLVLGVAVSKASSPLPLAPRLGCRGRKVAVTHPDAHSCVGSRLYANAVDATFLSQRSPTFLALGTDLTEGDFSMAQGWGDGFRMTKHMAFIVHFNLTPPLI